MKAKYTFMTNGIKAELEFNEVTALDKGYIEFQIEEQFRILNNIDKEPKPEVKPELTKVVEDLFVDSLKDLAEEFSQNKNKK